jgi:MFS family permease
MKTARRDIAALSFALCSLTSAVNLEAPLYTAYARVGGFGVATTTLAFSAYVVGVIPVLLLFGGLSDTVGRRRVLLWGLGCSLLATLLMLWLPQLPALAVARWLLGVGTALGASAAPAYMAELAQDAGPQRSAAWVAASTALGFGLGAALTSLFLLQHFSLRPGSFVVQLTLSGLAMAAVAFLPETALRRTRSPWQVRWPRFPPGAAACGWAILLSWATVGWVIALLPFQLQAHGWQHLSGFVVFAVCSCGVLFQPWARRLAPEVSVQRGLLALPVAYAVLAYGVTQGALWAVMAGAVAASSVCYGFVYLGGLGRVVALAGEQTARASAGFFLMAYLGFSVPVVLTGLLMDHLDSTQALAGFGLLLLLGVSIVYPLLRTAKCADGTPGLLTKGASS